LAWSVAIGAVCVGNLVANALVHLAIRATGGRPTKSQILEVLGLSTMASAVNASLALLAVIMYELRPAAALLVLLPMAVLYGAYRAYLGQKQERSRLEALYEITRVLHASPQIDVALDAAATRTHDLFGVERVDILLLDQTRHGRVYLTTVNTTGTLRAMAPVEMSADHEFLPWLYGLQEAVVLAEYPPLPTTPLPARQVMAAPLVAESGPIGVIVAADPLADVGGFGDADSRLLEAIAGKISVSLRNGRLEDSLAELTLLKERLEEQVRSKDRFIATVSHELRTPLTTVLGLSHELGERRAAFSDRELDEIVSLIALESTELSHLIEDLLVGARADIATLALRSQLVNLEDELEMLVQGHSRQNLVSPVRIAWHTARGSVWADPLRLRQIVRNLLSNASRYGGEDIWIEVEGTKDYVTVAVVDSGDGVGQAFEMRIFEAYERAHVDGQAQPGSVGLGLSVSRKLAELMGGSLVYRRAADNTRFELVLPVQAS
jgi:K+-sensing histidine kinase KdpD